MNEYAQKILNLDPNAMDLENNSYELESTKKRIHKLEKKKKRGKANKKTKKKIKKLNKKCKKLEKRIESNLQELKPKWWQDAIAQSVPKTIDLIVACIRKQENGKDKR